MTRTVGITGFTTRAEVDAARAVLSADIPLMVGVLVSEKSLRGERPRLWRRYPRPEDVAGIFSDDPRCLNLIHYCADEPPGPTTLDHLITTAGPHLHGFQFNGAWPKPATLALLSGRHVVLQVRPIDGDPDALDRLRAAFDALRKCRAHVLIDGSGGRGIPLHPDVADAWGMTIRGHFGNDVGLVFAGGLGPEHLWRLAAPIQDFNASIDVEGPVRDGDEGGVLNPNKVRDFLRVAGEIFGGRG